MRKLQFAERACSTAAILISIPVLGAICGHGQNTNHTATVALLAVVFLLMFIAYRLRRRIHALGLEMHNRLPVNAVKSTVVKGRVGYRYQPSGGKGGVRSGPPLYYLTFESEDGKRMELYVSRAVYFAVQEGACGILRYKGDEFISFH